MKVGKFLLIGFFLAAAGVLVGSMVFMYRVGLIVVDTEAKMAAQLQVVRQLQDFTSAFKDAGRRASRALQGRTLTYIAAGSLNLAFLGWMFGKISREMRRRHAAALEVSRQKELLSTTLASIGDAVIVTDAEGRVTFLNAEAELLTG